MSSKHTRKVTSVTLKGLAVDTGSGVGKPADAANSEDAGISVEGIDEFPSVCGKSQILPVWEGRILFFHPHDGTDCPIGLPAICGVRPHVVRGVVWPQVDARWLHRIPAVSSDKQAIGKPGAMHVGELGSGSRLALVNLAREECLVQWSKNGFDVIKAQLLEAISLLWG